MIFVDSGGWFAGVVTDDEDHEKAKLWLSENKEPLFTTNYIVDETLTLLRSRGENRKALEVGRLFFDGLLAEIYYLTEEDILQTWKIFQKFSDKDWSFTDCSSKYVCEKFRITHAFSFDKHFRQFGTVTVVP
ncbi:MAG: PIN domain-containing protein [Acidobacteriota bacterium]|nr:PIN domain-containing protein [Acidobacteriota bacterium]